MFSFFKHITFFDFFFHVFLTTLLFHFGSKIVQAFVVFKLFSFSLKLSCDFLELLGSTSSNHRNTSKAGCVLNMFIFFLLIALHIN